MPARPFIALLLLVNYLLVVGTGCVSQPDEQSGRLLVQTRTADRSYQECRYLRMDGLENFLNEALTSRCQNKSETPRHHLISVVSSVDAHCLTPVVIVLPARLTVPKTAPRVAGQPSLSTDRKQELDAPPWLG